ncbi:hypothetical protein CYMTET_35977, partial [Cymbomonas tetramitiformis]
RTISESDGNSERTEFYERVGQCGGELVETAETYINQVIAAFRLELGLKEDHFRLTARPVRKICTDAKGAVMRDSEEYAAAASAEAGSAQSFGLVSVPGIRGGVALPEEASLCTGRKAK